MMVSQNLLGGGGESRPLFFAVASLGEPWFFLAMQLTDLDFEYPPSLIATERKPNSRVMRVENGEPLEVSVGTLLNEIQPEDLLVVNTTKVIPARVISQEGLEVLFIENIEGQTWKVLCPARRWPKGKSLHLPGGVELQLVQTGLPQTVEASEDLSLSYFQEHGDWPLPPYIQEARGQRESRSEDATMYQTDWAKDWGSLAAPTASFHLSSEHIEKIKARGSGVAEVTLHVGLGTFLPIHSSSLDEHEMHKEQVFVPDETWKKVQETRRHGGRVWALGSTVTRALESQAAGMFPRLTEGFGGETDLFIRPGYEFQVVDVLMTNFHQPKTTLLAMVMAFADVSSVQKCYQWAVERQFRLFSYGDLSVWLK